MKITNTDLCVQDKLFNLVSLNRLEKNTSKSNHNITHIWENFVPVKNVGKFLRGEKNQNITVKFKTSNISLPLYED